MSVKRGNFLVLLLIIFSITAAACGGLYVSGNSQMSFTEYTVALKYDSEKSTQTLVTSPAFDGKAEEFGYVMPTPSKPEITTKNSSFFKDLTDIKENEELDFGFGAGSIGSTGVQVVEQGSAGVYEYAILKGNSSQPLIKWMEDNNYTIKKQTRDNIDKYMEDEYYFSAFKVNLSRAECYSEGEIQNLNRHGRNIPNPGSVETEDSSECYFHSSMKPIEFSFETENPQIPVRILEGQHAHAETEYTDFRVYSVSEKPLVVPGSKVHYSDKVKSSKHSFLDSRNNFFVEQSFKIDTRDIDSEINFQKVKYFHVYDQSNAKVNDKDRQSFLNSGYADYEIEVSEGPSDLSNKVKFAFDRNIVGFLKTILFSLIWFVFMPFLLPGYFIALSVLFPMLSFFLVVNLFWNHKVWEPDKAVRGIVLSSLVPALLVVKALTEFSMYKFALTFTMITGFLAVLLNIKYNEKARIGSKWFQKSRSLIITTNLVFLSSYLIYRITSLKPVLLVLPALQVVYLGFLRFLPDSKIRNINSGKPEYSKKHVFMFYVLISILLGTIGF